jgi:hypothetical protein
MQVYVRPFPNVTATRYLISTEVGYLPIWAHSGRELFYLNLAFELVAVEVRPGPPFSLGEPRPLFQLPQGVFEYDVGPDDRRFLVLRPENVGGDRELIVVENWVEELKARVGN